MKGYALVQRDKKKDAYDIYFCVRNYRAGTDLPTVVCQVGVGSISGKYPVVSRGFGV